MARDTVGHIGCPYCTADSEVRLNKKGKYYLYCSDGCGLIQATGDKAQAFFKANMRPIGEPLSGAPVPAPVLKELDELPAENSFKENQPTSTPWTLLG
jgi:hypothetical protein